MVEEGGRRSPLRASLGDEKGPSVPVIFCFMWLHSHGGWLGRGGGGMRPPRRASLGAKKGPSVPLIFCVM